MVDIIDGARAVFGECGVSECSIYSRAYVSTTRLAGGGGAKRAAKHTKQLISKLTVSCVEESKGHSFGLRVRKCEGKQHSSSARRCVSREPVFRATAPDNKPGVRFRAHGLNGGDIHYFLRHRATIAGRVVETRGSR